MGVTRSVIRGYQARIVDKDRVPRKTVYPSTPGMKVALEQASGEKAASRDGLTRSEI